jgi:hypothetical protein
VRICKRRARYIFSAAAAICCLSHIVDDVF